MMEKRRRFRRPQANRPYNKLFIISAEGDQTEPQYFDMLNKMSKSTVKCLNNLHGTSPIHILKVMKTDLKKRRLRKGDEAWIVVDRDIWESEDLDALVEWAKENGNFYLALSNPKFEYWLLLHFEEGNTRLSSFFLDPVNTGLRNERFRRSNSFKKQNTLILLYFKNHTKIVFVLMR